jgi:hypothetical protein
VAQQLRHALTTTSPRVLHLSHELRYARATYFSNSVTMPHRWLSTRLCRLRVCP